ncbi:CBO0543 family protein [Neobacillus sp. D3-1R]|uniref:CBO0543 family protein n=1 Tax=Neobacillus sp. D3-1R TaxID=3445778 RepID=UPI003FA0B304
MQELINLTRKLAEKRNEYWLENVIFTYQWWILLSLTILPWLLWWKWVDKKRVIEIFLYGSLISLYSILLDDIGSHFILWIYQYQLFPISPRLNPIDLTIMPVTFMVVYQYFKRWKSFLIAQMILAFGAAFIAEPLFSSVDIYHILNWKLVFSFVIYLLLGIGNKIVVERLVHMQDRK